MFFVHYSPFFDNVSLSPGFYQVAKLTMPLHPARLADPRSTGLFPPPKQNRHRRAANKRLAGLCSEGLFE